MRKLLHLVLLLLCFSQSHAQQGYAGFTGDFNSGIGERYTYGLGIHTEMRAWHSNNLYFNWHYSLGSNTHGEIYGHGGMSLMLYKSDDWWRNNTRTWDEFLATLLGPLLIPNGITYYLPNHSTACNHKRLRVGIYCNPIAMDYWKMEPAKVTSWTIEAGAKLLWETNSEQILYFAGGCSFTNNIRRNRPYGGYGNEELVHVQIGLLGILE